MRRYRKGLIQTPEQLRFGFLAIIQGIKTILNLKIPHKTVPLNKADEENIPSGSNPASKTSLGVPSDDESETVPLLSNGTNNATDTPVGSPTNNNMDRIAAEVRFYIYA